MIWAGTNGYLDGIPVSKVRRLRGWPAVADARQARRYPQYHPRQPRPVRRRCRPSSRTSVEGYAKTFRVKSAVRVIVRLMTRGAGIAGHDERRGSRSDQRLDRRGERRMASLKDMRVRIASTKATQKITKAMQMVAASKLRRAQKAAEAARALCRADGRGNRATSRALPQGRAGAPALLAGTGKDNVHLLLVCTGERGLSGRVQLVDRAPGRASARWH